MVAAAKLAPRHDALLPGWRSEPAARRPWLRVNPPSRRRIQLRTIDVRRSARLSDNALPHELFYILLADHFEEVPLWCDEGLALPSTLWRSNQLTHEISVPSRSEAI